MTYTINSMVQELARIQIKQIDDSILKQLNEFISRGLLVVEQKQPVLIQDSRSSEIRVSTFISLKLKDQEYIEKLEIENKEMKKDLDDIKHLFTNKED